MANHLLLRNLNRCGQEISVLERSLDGSDFNSSDPVETFTEIATPLAIVKTLTTNFTAASKLFGSVSIDPNTTHVFCVLYTAPLSAVETQNYFIDLNSKRYKVLAVTNIDEKDEVLAFQATQRGDSSLEATQA